MHIRLKKAPIIADMISYRGDAGAVPACATSGRVAQLVEHPAVNRKVVGSKPTFTSIEYNVPTAKAHYANRVIALTTRKIPSTTISNAAVALKDSLVAYAKASLMSACADQRNMIRDYLSISSTSFPPQTEEKRCITNVSGRYDYIIAELSRETLAVLSYMRP